jgi:hypothetical protein
MKVWKKWLSYERGEIIALETVTRALSSQRRAAKVVEEDVTEERTDQRPF